MLAVCSFGDGGPHLWQRISGFVRTLISEAGDLSRAFPTRADFWPYGKIYEDSDWAQLGLSFAWGSLGKTGKISLV
jgi:hypothetical protein